MSASRKALVTGAASGIGRAIAARLVEDGHDVLSVDIGPDPDGPGDSFAADLTTVDGNRAAVEEAVGLYGGLDLIVPCAGFQHVSPVEDFDEATWQSMLALLLTSPFLLSKFAWPHLTESGRGQIVIVASVHGLVASPYKSAYVSAKHGVIGLSKVLALEGADQGIRVVAVCPGYGRTPLVEKQIPEQAEAHGLPEDDVLRDVILSPHAVKELIEPEDVADTVAFLLTRPGRTITGSPLVMDMGWSAR